MDKLAVSLPAALNLLTKPLITGIKVELFKEPLGEAYKLGLFRSCLI